MTRRSPLFWFLPLLLALGGTAFAQTAADTEITNQAFATYTDSAGVEQTAESNIVTTIVQAVFGFEIAPNGTLAAPGQTATAAAGEEVVFTYTVTNIGNDEDTITLSTGQDGGDDGNLVDPTFYEDTDDSGDYTPGVDQPVTSIDLTAVGTAGDTATFFLVGTVPDNVADGDIINVQPVGESLGDPDYDELVEDGTNWSQVNALTLAELTLTKTASAANVEPGDTLTYTLDGENIGGSSPFALPNVATVNGSAVSGILISDDFDNALTYVPGSLTGSYTSPGATATSTVLYSTDNGATWTTTEPETGVNAVGFLIQFPAGTRLNDIDEPTLEYTLEFDVTVPATAQDDDSYSNVGVLTVDNNGDGDPTDPNETVTTPPTMTDVDQTPGVNIGNSDGDDATEPSDVEETVTTTPGTPVSIPLELTNDGNGPDTFDLTIPNLPTGWDADFFLDTDCDGVADGGAITDSGELASGENICLVLTVTPPAGTIADDYPLDITATSESDPAVSDVITDTVTVDNVPAVNIGNGDGNETTAPSNTPVSNTTNPGDPVSTPLEVTNNGNSPDTFDLTPTVPTGWTADLFPDADCNGIADGTTPITDTGILAPGENFCFVLTVTPPAGTTPDTYDVTTTATSTNDPTITDSITNTVTVNLDEGFEFTEDLPQTTTPGSEVTYTHTATNNSNTTLTVGLAITEPGTPTWTYEYGLDRNGNGDVNDAGDIPFGPLSAIDGFTLAPGETADVLVLVTVPTTALSGAVDSYNLTATPTYNVDGTPTPGDPITVTDVTTIIAGTIEVSKSVSVNGAPATQADTEAVPGDTLTYTIVATNTGDAPVSNVIVSDALPANTDFVSISGIASFPGDVLFATSATGPWAATLPSLATDGTVYVGVDTNGDTTIDGDDTFPDGETLTITFTVTIQ